MTTQKIDPQMLRKMAAELRKKAEDLRTERLVKCAKYVVGMTALMQLSDKIRSLK